MIIEMFVQHLENIGLSDNIYQLFIIDPNICEIKTIFNSCERLLLGTGLEVTDGITTPQNEVVTDLIQHKNREWT